MLLRTKFKMLEDHVDFIEQGASRDILFLERNIKSIAKSYTDLASDYGRLKRHISNNGLWRAVKELKKRVDDLHTYQQNLAQILNDMNTNGVATAINKLNREVFGKSKQSGSDIEQVLLRANGVEPRQDPTLSAKVDAIIAHLGLDVTVEPETVTRTPAKVVAKKVKPVKKGRR
jgi:hypothetical protein